MVHGSSSGGRRLGCRLWCNTCGKDDLRSASKTFGVLCCAWSQGNCSSQDARRRWHAVEQWGKLNIWKNNYIMTWNLPVEFSDQLETTCRSAESKWINILWNTGIQNICQPTACAAHACASMPSQEALFVPQQATHFSTFLNNLCVRLWKGARWASKPWCSAGTWDTTWEYLGYIMVVLKKCFNQTTSCYTMSSTAWMIQPMTALTACDLSRPGRTEHAQLFFGSLKEHIDSVHSCVAQAQATAHDAMDVNS